jgi:transcriptional regulator of acetoin/glycerol metabolism
MEEFQEQESHNNKTGEMTMQKMMIEFSYKINDKDYRIQCDPNSPIADVKEAAYLFMKDIGQIEDQQKQQQQQVEAEKQDAEKQKEQPKEQING